MCLTRSPHKAHAPLVVDANAVLPAACAFEQFQPIVGWNAQIVYPFSVSHHTQFAPRNGLDLIGQRFGKLTLKDKTGGLRGKAGNHESMLSFDGSIVKQERYESPQLSRWRYIPFQLVRSIAPW